MRKVLITATQLTHLAKQVEMSDEDLAEYDRICEAEDMRERDKDREIMRLAEKYGFDAGDDQSDWDDPEEVTFTEQSEGGAFVAQPNTA